MVLHGKDLVVLADGVAIAMSKSCDINVEADIIPTSSPTDGDWEHSISGRKSWKVTTNHLLRSVASMAMKVGSTVTLTMKVVDGVGLPFSGMVDNVSLETGTETSPEGFVWDTTRKCFLALGHAQRDTYYISWSGGQDYANPEGKLFWDGNTVYTVIDGELTQEQLTGSAHCRLCKVTATKGNLAQGSFSWTGTGALTAGVISNNNS